MTRKVMTIAAGQFRARCLPLLEEVAADGRTIVVTRRGKPVAKIVPVAADELQTVPADDEADERVDDRWGLDR